MPGWTDEGGNDTFNKLCCKRCLQYFESEHGEVPIHECIGGKYKSRTYISPSGDVEYHEPVKVR